MLSPSRRVHIVAALAAGLAASSLASPIVGVLAPYIIVEFDISAGTLGVATSVYYLAASALSPLAGSIVERSGPMAALRWLLVFTPVGLLAMASARQFAVFVLAVAVGAFPLALANPATNAATAEWLPPGSRGSAVGWKQAGVPGAWLVVGLLAPSLAVVWGWRVAAVSTAAVVVVGSGLLLLPLRQPRKPGRGAGRRDPGAAAERVAASGFGWLVGYSTLMGGAVGASNTYLVQFAVDGYGFSPAAAGRLAVIAGGLGAFTRVVLATVGERRGATTRMLALLGGVATLAVLLTSAGPAAGAWGAIAGAALLGTTVYSWNGVAMLSVVIGVPLRQVGATSGRLMLGFYMGLLLGPLLFGQLVDHAGYGWAWALVGVATSSAGGLALRRG